MKSKLQKRISFLICFIFLLTFGYGQLVNAQDAAIYDGYEIQKFTAESLEGTKPDVNDSSIKTIDLTDGTVKFTLEIPNGLKYDILRSDNGGQYKRLTDFLLDDTEFTDKYALNGHTYYYLFVTYDAKGNVLGSDGPYKAIVPETASSSKTIILQIDNQDALVNGVKYKLDVKPFIKDGRTMVPLSFISQAIGAQVKWTGNEQKITVNLNGNNITLWIGKSEAKINDKTVYMDVPAIISNGRTLVPIGFISESLKLKIGFNSQTKQITISGGQADKQQQKVISIQQPSGTAESILIDILKSSKKYSGESSNGSATVKYSISFYNYIEQTGEFKGEIDWTGYDTTDDIVGKLDGDKIVFKQTARHQKNGTTPLDTDVTMKVESNKLVSGSWVDLQTGDTGTTWFEITPSDKTQATYKGEFDANGFPTGKATLDFGNNITFNGEVKVKSDNFIAIGVVNYPDGTKVIGRFVNGKPDGLSSIIYPDQNAYLIDFNYGKPVDFYVANTIPVYKADEIDVYKADDVNAFNADDIEEFKADDIEEFKADDIEEFKADDIEEFKADDIEPYKADMIEMYKATPVEKYESIANIKRFEAEVVKLNPPGASSTNIPVGGFSSPDYMNPLVQTWTAHMNALPYLINNNMVYSY